MSDAYFILLPLSFCLYQAAHPAKPAVRTQLPESSANVDY